MSDLDRPPLRALVVHDELAGESAETRALAALAVVQITQIDDWGLLQDLAQAMEDAGAK